MTDGGEKPNEATPTEARRNGRGADLRTPERLGRVDVADPRDDALIQEHGLDRPVTPNQRRQECVGREGGIGGFEPELEQRGRICRMQFDGRESAGIHERDACAVAEVDGSTRILRQGIIAAPDVPIAGHAKMNVKASVVIQLQQLMLATAGDAGHPRPAQCSQAVRGDATPECRVDERDTIDDLSDGRLPQDAGSAFDFR